MDVADISVESIGSYDVVLFLGVLYHLKNPMSVLERLCAVTNEMMIIESHYEDICRRTPVARFYPGAELNNDPTNWWGPNKKCLEDMLSVAGFRRVECVYRFGNRIVFHAFKSAAPSDGNQR